MLKKNRTYTVVFMKVIGGNNMTANVPNFQRQYKNKSSAYRAMSKYFAVTGNEAFIVRGDDRDSHKKKLPMDNDSIFLRSFFGVNS